MTTPGRDSEGGPVEVGEGVAFTRPGARAPARYLDMRPAITHNGLYVKSRELVNA